MLILLEAYWTSLWPFAAVAVVLSSGNVYLVSGGATPACVKTPQWNNEVVDTSSLIILYSYYMLICYNYLCCIAVEPLISNPHKKVK